MSVPCLMRLTPPALMSLALLLPAGAQAQDPSPCADGRCARRGVLVIEDRHGSAGREERWRVQGWPASDGRGRWVRGWHGPHQRPDWPGARRLRGNGR